MTSHWHEIKSSNINTHNVLGWMAAKIYEQTSITVTVAQADTVDLKLAIEGGFLETANDKVSFVDSQIQLDFLVRHTADLLDRSWVDSEIFFDTLRQVIRFSARVGYSKEIASLAILLLSLEYERDLANRLIESAVLSNSIDPIKKNNFWGLYDLFFEVFPSLTIEIKTVIAIFDALGENFERVRGQVYKTIEKISSDSQDSAEYLSKELLLRSKSPVCHLLIDVLRGIAKSDLPKAHQRALMLSESEEPILRRLGICSLGDFDYSQESSQTLLASTLERLKTLLESSDPETDSVLVRAYGDLLRYTSEVETVIVELSNSPNPVIWKQVMSILFLQADKSSEMGWYRRTLLNLVQTHEFSGDDMSSLDYCIEKYVLHEPEFTFQIIQTLAVRWKFARHEGYTRLAEGLNSTFITLGNNQRLLLMSKFTEWVASNHRYLHLLAFEVNDYFNTIPVRTEGTEVERNKNPSIVLNKEVLDTLDEQVICNILYRIVGYEVFANPLSALLLSSLKREQCSPKVVNLVKSLLTDYVLYNYPHEAGNYLQKRLKDQGITQLEKEVIQVVLSDSNQYFEDRQKLPRMKELQPSSKQTYLLRLAQWKQQEEMMERSEGRSIFTQMVTNVFYKYGRAFSGEREGVFSEPTPFVLHSISTEIPQGEHIDPVGHSYQRLWGQLIALDLNRSENDNSEGEK